MQANGSNCQWLIPLEIWKSEVMTGHDPKLAARALADRNMLKRPNDGKGYTCVERVGGQPQRFYVVLATLLEEQV